MMRRVRRVLGQLTSRKEYRTALRLALKTIDIQRRRLPSKHGSTEKAQGANKIRRQGHVMRKVSALAVTFFVCAGTCQPQDHKTRVFLTGTDQTLGNTSNVSAAEVGKALDKHCPQVVLTIEQQKADYLLQATNTGAGVARKPYKFTLFDATSDRVFSTETSRLESAVKDVCAYIRKHKQ
jgi:hypothetical protein